MKLSFAFKVFLVISLADFSEATAQNYSFLLHGTDLQWTFLKRSAIPGRIQIADGAVAVEGTQHSLPQIIQVLAAVYASRRGRISLSADSHSLAEFTANQIPHGLVGRHDQSGNALIEELDHIIPKEKQFAISPQAPTGTFDVTSLDLIPKFEKNGPSSHNVFSNPYFGHYIETADPHKFLPHFHLGWCTDFCNRAVILEELKRGYTVFVIVDAIAGIFPSRTKAALKEMAHQGAKFISAGEFLKLLREWRESQLDSKGVAASLRNWERESVTKQLVFEKLEQEAWHNQEAACSVILLGKN